MPTRPQVHRAQEARLAPSGQYAELHGTFYGRRWRKAKAAFLAEHPLCRVCADAGLTVAASVVDHVTPHKWSYEAFWRMENWQGLCVRCHNSKTAKENKSR